MKIRVQEIQYKKDFLSLTPVNGQQERIFGAHASFPAPFRGSETFETTFGPVRSRRDSIISTKNIPVSEIEYSRNTSFDFQLDFVVRACAVPLLSKESVFRCDCVHSWELWPMRLSTEMCID